MSQSIIANLLKQLNATRGLKYPQIGYTYYADIRGNGVPHRYVYVIVNEGGGVRYSDLNGSTPRGTARLVRTMLKQEESISAMMDREANT